MSDNMDFDDLDFDDLDLDGDGGFNDGQSGKNNAKNRNPITSVIGGFVSGIKRGLFNENNVGRLIDRALPMGYGDAYRDLLTAKNEVMGVWDEATEQGRKLQGEVGNLFKEAQSNGIVPNEGRFANFAKAMAEHAPSNYGSSSSDPDKSEMTAALGSVFGEAVKAVAEAQQDDPNAPAKLKIDVANFQANMQQTQDLAKIRQATMRLAAYQDSILIAYHRKSLELQYKQYFVSRKLLDVSQQNLKANVSYLKSIQHNTALPDAIKIRSSELFRHKLKENFVGALAQPFYSNFGQMAGRVATKVKASVREMASGIGTGLSMASMPIGMIGMEAEANNRSVAHQLGHEFGNTAGGWVAGLLTDMFGDKIRDKIGQDATLNKIGSSLRLQTSRSGKLSNMFFKHGNSGNILLDGARALFGLNELTHKNTTRVRGDMTDDMDKAAFFDNQAKRTLTEIIPGYLSRIHHELYMTRTGDTAASPLTFDFKTSQFITKQQRGEDFLDEHFNQKSHDDIQKYLDGILEKFEATSLSPEAQKQLKKLYLRASMENEFVSVADLATPSSQLAQDQSISDSVKEEIRKHAQTFAGIDDAEVDRLNQMTRMERSRQDVSLQSVEKIEELERAHNYMEYSIKDVQLTNQAIQAANLGDTEILRDLGIIYLKTDALGKKSWHIDREAYTNFLLSGQRPQMGGAGNAPNNPNPPTPGPQPQPPGSPPAGAGGQPTPQPPGAGQPPANPNTPAQPPTITPPAPNPAGSQTTTSSTTSPYLNPPNTDLYDRLDQIYERLGETPYMNQLNDANSQIATLSNLLGGMGDMLQYLVDNGIGTHQGGNGQGQSGGPRNTPMSTWGAIRHLGGKVIRGGGKVGAWVGKKAWSLMKLPFKGIGLGWKLTKALFKGVKALPNSGLGVFGKIGPVTDIYSKAQGKVVLTALGIKNGAYIDKNTGKVIKKLKDITGPVLDSNGVEILSAQDLTEDLYYRRGIQLIKLPFSALGLAIKLGFGVVSGGFGVVRKLWKAAAWTVKKIGAVVNWLGNKPLPDVYLPGENNPRIQSVKARQGHYVRKEDGKVVSKIDDLFGTILDDAGNTVLMPEDCAKVVDVSGKRIKRVKGRILSAIGRGVTGVIGGAARLAWGTAKLGWKLSVGTLKLVGRILAGAGKGVLSGFNGVMFGMGAKVVEELQKIYKLLDERLPKRAKGDSDGDGVDDGSAADQRSKWQKFKDASKARWDGLKDKSGRLWDKTKDKAKDMGKGLLDKGKGIMDFFKDHPTFAKLLLGGGLGAGLANMLGFDSAQGMATGGALGMGGSLFLPWLAKKAGGALLRRFAGGAAANAAANAAGGAAANAAGSAAANAAGTAAGQAGQGLLRRAGTSIATRFAQSSLTRLAVGQGIRTAAGGILSGVLSAPVLLGVAAVALVGYAGYKIYQHMTRHKRAIFTFRMAQYGFEFSDSDTEKLQQLETMCKQYLKVSKGSQAYFEKGDVTPMMDLFGVKMEDKEDVEAWLNWFQNRFKPVYLSHMTVLMNTKGNTKLEDADKFMTAGEKVDYLKAVHFTGAATPYQIMTSPFSSAGWFTWRSDLSYGQSDVEETYNDLMKACHDAVDTKGGEEKEKRRVEQEKEKAQKEQEKKKQEDKTKREKEKKEEEKQKTELPSYWDAVKDRTRELWNGASNAVSSAASWLSDKASKLADGVQNMTAGAYEALGGGGSGLFSKGTLELTPQDVLDLAKVTTTEVVASLSTPNMQAQAAGVIDTILNRVASGKRKWENVRKVINDHRQFSKITGPASLKPYGSIENMPDSAVNPVILKFVQTYLQQRAGGAPSSVAGNLNYANPYYSDQSSMRSWVSKLWTEAKQANLIFGSGRAIHAHGTTDDLKRFMPGPFKVVLKSGGASGSTGGTGEGGGTPPATPATPATAPATPPSSSNTTKAPLGPVGVGVLAPKFNPAMGGSQTPATSKTELPLPGTGPMDKKAQKVNMQYSSATGIGVGAAIAQSATANAERKSHGYCARYVSNALQKAGYKFTRANANEYPEKVLRPLGFVQLPLTTPVEIGDIMCWSGVPKHPYGHVQIWNGKNWVSDFVQRNVCPWSNPAGSQPSLWRDKKMAATVASTGTGKAQAAATVAQVQQTPPNAPKAQQTPYPSTAVPTPSTAQAPAVKPEARQAATQQQMLDQGKLFKVLGQQLLAQQEANTVLKEIRTLLAQKPEAKPASGEVVSDPPVPQDVRGAKNEMPLDMRTK